MFKIAFIWRLFKLLTPTVDFLTISYITSKATLCDRRLLICSLC